MSSNNKIVAIPVSKVSVDHSFNPRKAKQYTREALASLMSALALSGQKVAGAVSDHGDTFLALQGNRRASAIAFLAEDGVEDPLTCKVDKETGLPVAGTGKPFSTFNAVVHTGLNRLQEVGLMADQSDALDLDRVELFNLYSVMRRAGKKDNEITIDLNSIMNRLYTLPSRIRSLPETTDAEVKDKEKKIIDFRKGSIQQMNRLYALPDEAQDAGRRSMDGDSSGVQVGTSEAMALYKAMKEDVEHDRQFGRTNPGPQYKLAWQKIVDAYQEGLRVGKPAKATSIMNASDIRKLGIGTDACQSKVIKLLIAIINRDLTDAGAVATLDNAAVALEALSTPEVNAVFDELFSKIKVTVVPPAPTEVKTDVPSSEAEAA